MIPRFDAYTATTRAARAQDLMGIVCGLTDRIREGKGHHGFEKRVSFVGDDGQEHGSVSWGGTIHGDLVMMEVKGSRTPDVVQVLRTSYEHRCTRVDSCYDIDQPGAFEELLKPCIDVKKAFRLKGSKAGDWEDFPEDGRTFYMGARTSPVRLRLYEKGRQPEYRHLGRQDWARIELQVRPSKEAKDAYSKATPVEVWGASAWSRDLAAKVLEAQLEPLPAGTTYKLSEQERKLRFLCKQYGPTLMQLASDLGSWEMVGPNLRQIILANKGGRQ